MVELTVLVLEYSDQTSPIGNATITTHSVDARDESTSTSVDGIAIVQVPTGLEVRIDAAAAGYRPFAAAGTVTAPGERWTFFLEAQ